MSLNKFAAIDFETANHHRSSVCSVGIVIVEDGEIIDQIYELIRPNPNFYYAINTSIHGLTRNDTDDANDFKTVWESIAPRVENYTLIAHNSPFDEGCLRAAHETYKMKYPNYKFLCTCQASRKVFPHLPNHKLGTVSDFCGYDLKNHHHALADAIACAEIAKKVFK